MEKEDWENDKSHIEKDQELMNKTYGVAMEKENCEHPRINGTDSYCRDCGKKL